MSMVAESPSKHPGDDVIECTRCGSIKITTNWIEQFEVTHCICELCTNEWVE